MGWKRQLASQVPGGLLSTAHVAYWARHKTDFLRDNPCPTLDLPDGLRDRPQFYQQVYDDLVRPPITYLEFGVLKGESIDAWRHIDTHADSVFYGFDTFEGLPEAWKNWQPGHLSADGHLPDIADSRVRFVRGLFQDTLPKTLTEIPHERQFVVHIDSDLYSSCLYVLASLDKLTKPGDVLLFDQWGRDDEYRAFQDYRQAFRRHLEPRLSMNSGYSKIAFTFG